MTYQAYLDNIKSKTGKTPDDFRKLAAKKGLTKYPELMVWLKSEFELWEPRARTSAFCATGKNLALSCLLPPNGWILASNSKVFHRLRGSKLLERGTIWSPTEYASSTRNK